MRKNRTLAIAVTLGLALSFSASANVVYPSETTNAWFNAGISALPAGQTLPGAWSWSGPFAGGEATVKTKSGSQKSYIELDTDLDDPLTYSVTNGQTEGQKDVAVVAAEMTATVNTALPELSTVPQAALTVIGTSSGTNWVGLVGNEQGGTTWVTFANEIPVAGETYSVRIEFDQRAGVTRQIRYLVGGKVLGNGWYPNPKTAAANIQSVSFSGSGNIEALAGENITENTFAFVAPTETAGYDFTNGSFSVGASIRGYTGVKATLKVVDFKGNSKTIGDPVSFSGQTRAQWDLTELEAGGFYDYTVEVKVGNQVIDTLSGTFYAANWPADIWFGADASRPVGSRETGGAWDQDATPHVENNAYTIDDEAIFNVDDNVQPKGSNHVTRVDATVTFDALVATPTTPEGDAFGGFVAAQNGWKALTRSAQAANEWVLLHGEIVPTTGVPYVIRAEVDFHTGGRGVRYFVTTATAPTDADFVPLYDANGSQWIPLANNSATTLQTVELQGSGSVAKFVATVADNAIAEVNGKKFDTMAAALAEAGTEGTNTIKLLTNATVAPTQPGSYEIAPNGKHYVSGGKVSTDTEHSKTIVIGDDPSKPPVVRPSRQVMEAVKTPSGKSYKNINSLRAFLEKNAPAYTNENATAQDIEKALNAPQTDDGKNGLELWKDYALGIQPTDSIKPVTTPAGDVDPNKITLSIPKVAAATPSEDYTIAYEVVDKDGKQTSDSQEAGAIKIPLDTGTYTIKAVFTATPAQAK